MHRLQTDNRRSHTGFEGDGGKEERIGLEIHERAVLELPVSKVWEALNDPNVLKLCVPGCQEISVVDATTLKAKAVTKMGFITAKFEDIQMKKLQAVENEHLVLEMAGEDTNRIGSFRMKMELKLGAVPGDAPKTSMQIDAIVDMKGKFATLGRKLVEWKARGMMEEFVKNLGSLRA
jgi:uncharacterized protein